MPKKTTKKAVKKVIEPEIEEVKKAETPKEVKKEFSVFNGDTFIRTYSVEIHGENAGELAEMYAAKIGGYVK